MENQDKIYEQFKNAAEKSEARDFPAMEKVWARVEEKLDKKEDKKVIALWKKLTVAASILLFVALGYHFYNNESNVIDNNNVRENSVVNSEIDSDSEETEKAAPTFELNSSLRTDAAEILNKQIDEPQVVYTENNKEAETAEESVMQSDVDALIAPSHPNPSILEKKAVNLMNMASSEVELRANLVPSKDYGAKKEMLAETSDLAKAKAETIVVKTITGVVSDATGPIPGANVIVVGTNNGTQTNIDGKYSISAEKGDVLEFSYVGMQSKTTVVGAGTIINMTLSDNSMALGEVVVTAYGTKRPKGKKSERQQEFTQQVANPKVIQMLEEKAAVLRRGTDNSYRDGDKNTARVPSKGNSEDYDSFIENAFESPKNAPLSTFSIDVDNASYTNIRRFINNGQSVPKDAVRVEEMVNFFKYQYPQPTDKHPFSINTEYSDCPWNTNHKLLRIGLQGKSIPMDNLPASNLVFLIDVSGSMSDDNKLPLLKQSLKILVNELRREDKVAIVVYAGAAGMVLPPTSGSEKQKIIDALDQLNAGGSTAGGAGIELAYKLAQENFVKNGNNRVILATDGDFNVGSSSNSHMQTLIEEKRKSGVFLTCLGYGMGNYKDSKMEILSDKGNGNYAYIDNIQEANRFLGKEFKGSMYAIAKDVKIQIEFNPKHVQSYRLIGYENRKLRAEDFANDAIDAGELGSGHTVTALYEIIPVGIKSDYFNEAPELKYTKTEAGTTNFNDELATVKFRYKLPDGDKSTEMLNVISTAAVPLSQSTSDFRFSAAVAWFGLKLRDSKLIDNKSVNDIKKLAKEGLSNDVDGYKAEFIRLVETVK